MHYPFLKFLAAIAIAEAGYAFGIVVAGESLAIDRPLTFFFIAVGILAVVAALAGLVLRAARRCKSGGLKRSCSKCFRG